MFRNENLKDSRLLRLVTTLKILNVLIIGCVTSIFFCLHDIHKIYVDEIGFIPDHQQQPIVCQCPNLHGHYIVFN